MRADKSVWRQTAILGAVFTILGSVAMLTSLFWTDVNAQFLDRVFNDPNSIHAPSVSGTGDYIAIVFFGIILALPYTVGAVGIIMWRRSLVSDPLSQSIMDALGFGAFTLAMNVIILYYVAEMYAESPQQRRLLFMLMAVAIWVYNFLVEVVFITLAADTYRHATLPRWLSLTFGAIGVLAFVLNLLSFDPNMPALRFVIASVVQSFGAIMLSAYLWIAARSG